MSTPRREYQEQRSKLDLAWWEDLAEKKFRKVRERTTTI